MARFMLGLDQGTSSSRAILVDRAGRVRGLAAVPVGRQELAHGWVDQDADECWDSLRKAVRKLLRSSGAGARDVQGIGLACQRSTSVAYRRGELSPLLPAISWQCQRTRPFMQGLSSRHRRDLEVRTGLPAAEHYHASKARWLLDRLPARRRRDPDLVLGTLDSLLAARLAESGEPVTDLTQATRTLLVDLGERDWSAKNLRLFGLSRQQRPQIVPTCGEFGRLARGALPPLPAGVPLLALAGDQQAALFGAGMRQRAAAKITYGSGAFFLCAAGSRLPTSNHPGIIRSVAWSDAQHLHYLLETNVPSAGTVIEWLTRLTGRPFADLLASDRRRGDLEQRLGETVFLPTFAGMGPPFPELAPGGRLDGLTHAVEGPALASALALGIAFLLSEGLAVAESLLRTRVRRIAIDGGGSRDGEFAAIQADGLRRPLFSLQSPEATAFGAAALAWQAADGKAPALPHARRAVKPRLSAAAHRRLREHWWDAFRHLLAERGT